jgi:hypothetical protein
MQMQQNPGFQTLAGSFNAPAGNPVQMAAAGGLGSFVTAPVTHQRSKTDLQKRAVEALRGGSEGCSIRSGESGESTSLADRSKKRNFKIYFKRENFEEVGRFRATNNTL